MTATDLSRRYLVGPDRLLEYSRRGNLPMSRSADGTILFDEDFVVRLFRSRSAAPAATDATSLAVLGSSRLGVATAPEISSREARRQEVWRQRRDVSPSVEVGVDRSKTG
jgi:hypothetical protein